MDANITRHQHQHSRHENKRIGQYTLWKDILFHIYSKIRRQHPHVYIYTWMLSLDLVVGFLQRRIPTNQPRKHYQHEPLWYPVSSTGHPFDCHIILLLPQNYILYSRLQWTSKKARQRIPGQYVPTQRQHCGQLRP